MSYEVACPRAGDLTPEFANPILAHQWGASKAQDRVLAEICGRAPSTKPWGRIFVVAQAYIDESYTNGEVHVVAGYMARAQDWARFAAEWEQLLPLTNLGTSNKRRFKMSEMAKAMERVPPFYEIIRNHAAFAISMAIDARDLERAKARIWSDNTEIVWSHGDNIQSILFRMFIGSIYRVCWDVPPDKGMA